MLPWLLIAAFLQPAAPVTERPQFAPEAIPPDRIGGDATTVEPAGKAALDTIWIADWSFDASGGGCADAGWVKVDGRIVNDGSNYWSINNTFSGTGGITGKAAVLSRHNL